MWGDLRKAQGLGLRIGRVPVSCMWGQPTCQRKMGVVKTTGLIGGGTTQIKLRPMVVVPLRLCPSSPTGREPLSFSVHSILGGTSLYSGNTFCFRVSEIPLVSLGPYDLLTASSPIHHQEMV